MVCARLVDVALRGRREGDCPVFDSHIIAWLSWFGQAALILALVGGLGLATGPARASLGVPVDANRIVPWAIFHSVTLVAGPTHAKNGALVGTETINIINAAKHVHSNGGRLGDLAKRLRRELVDRLPVVKNWNVRENGFCRSCGNIAFRWDRKGYAARQRIWVSAASHFMSHFQRWRFSDIGKGHCASNISIVGQLHVAVLASRLRDHPWTLLCAGCIQLILHGSELAPEHISSNASEYGSEDGSYSSDKRPPGYLAGEWVIWLLCFSAVICGVACYSIDERWPKFALIPLAIFAVLAILACVLLGHFANQMRSARLNGSSENVGVHAVVIAPRKLCDVQGEIFAADLVECAHDTALEDAPEAFDRVGVDRTDNVILRVMPDGMVRIVGGEFAVGRMLISREKRAFVGNNLANETTSHRPQHIR